MGGLAVSAIRRSIHRFSQRNGTPRWLQPSIFRSSSSVCWSNPYPSLSEFNKKRNAVVPYSSQANSFSHGFQTVFSALRLLKKGGRDEAKNPIRSSSPKH